MEKMEYEDRIVCFLDILGFKEHINRTVVGDSTQRQENIKRIASAIDSIRYFTDADKIKQNSTKKVTQFSDSIVISFLPNEESGVFYTLLELLWIQINLVMNNMLCRGGITRGELIHTEKILFGPAMINAYILESKAALYPRIILDESIIEAGIRAHAKHHYSYHELESIMSLLSQDSDGMYYIDYITKAQSELDEPDYDHPLYLQNLANIIENGLKATNPSILIKYYWLREKYNTYVKQVKEHYKDDIDIDISDAYLQLPEF